MKLNLMAMLSVEKGSDVYKQWKQGECRTSRRRIKSVFVVVIARGIRLDLY